MSLPPLAELDDVEARLGRVLNPGELTRVDALLRDASAVVRSYTRREFSARTTTDILRPRGFKVALPQRPVVRVISVSYEISYGGIAQVTPTAAWSFGGGYEVNLADPVLSINGPSFTFDDSNVWVQVTYEHGFAEIPDDVVAVVANMVTRTLSVPASGFVDTETIGPYTARYSASSSAGPLTLGEGDRRVLNRYKLTNRTVELRL